MIEEEEGLKVPNSAIVQKEFYIVPDECSSKSGTGGETGVMKQVYDEEGNQIDLFIPVTIYSKEENNYYIEDLNSTNGTWVNGEHLEYKEKQPIEPGDIIAFGREEYIFM